MGVPKEVLDAKQPVYHMNGQYFVLEPQKDITAYESALISTLGIMMQHDYTVDHIPQFVDKHDLYRHFRKIAG